MSDRLVLPIAWKAAFSPDQPPSPPLLSRGLLLTRTGGVVRAFDGSTGEPVWATEVHAPTAGGPLAVDVGAGCIGVPATVVGRPTTTVIAVLDGDGKEVWRRTLEGVIPGERVVFGGGALWFLFDRGTRRVLAFDASTGEARVEHDCAPIDPDGLLFRPGGVLVHSRSAVGGLFRVEGGVERLIDQPVLQATTHGLRVVATLQGATERSLVCFDPDRVTREWVLEGVDSMVAACDAGVIAARGRRPMLVSWSGELVRWLGEPLARDTLVAQTNGTFVVVSDAITRRVHRLEDGRELELQARPTVGLAGEGTRVVIPSRDALVAYAVTEVGAAQKPAARSRALVPQAHAAAEAGRRFVDDLVRRRSPPFPADADAIVRRQVARCMVERGSRSSPGFLEAVSTALGDGDRAVRIAAMVAAARHGLDDLASCIERVAICDDAGRAGTQDESLLLESTRRLCFRICTGDDATNEMASPEDASLRAVILGEPADEHDCAFLFLLSLVDPHAAPTDPCRPLPLGVIEMDGRYALAGSGQNLVWVPAALHWTGDGIDRPVRHVEPDCGFFVVQDPHAGGPAVSFEDARSRCAALAAESGAHVRLPTPDEWEQISRGTDGRPYPWGHDANPSGSMQTGWGLVVTTPFAGEWAETNGVGVVCGPRCATRQGAASDAHFDVRPIVETSVVHASNPGLARSRP